MDPLEQASYEVTEDDVVALYARVMSRSKLIDATYRRNWRNGITTGLLFAVVIAAAPYLGGASPRVGAIGAGVGIVVWALIWWRFASHHLTRRAFERKRLELADKMVRERQVPFTLGPNSVLLYPDSLMIIEQTAQVFKPWTVVNRIEKEPDALFIMCSDEAIIRVPRRAFVTNDDMERFVRTAEELAAGS